MNIGDVVTLPSGSGKMTVTAVSDDKVDVCWMGYNSHLIHTAVLPIACLKVCVDTTARTTPPWENQK